MHRSARLPSSFAPNALTAELARLKAQGTPIRDLTQSNPTAVGLAYPKDEIRAALGSPSVLGYAADPRGSGAAREAVAAYLGHGVTPEELILAASTSEAYAWCFKLLCDPGDEVLVPSPSYPLFEGLGRLENVVARPVPAWWHDRWNLDLAALDAACGPRTRAVLLVNPNNPTGQFVARSEWAGLVALCARRGLVLIVDEVFQAYPLEPEAGDLPTVLSESSPACDLIVLSGLSKVAALPQVKLGWMVLRGPQRQQIRESLEFIADHFLSVSASAQDGAAALLALAPGLQDQVRARLHSNLQTLDRSLAPYPHLGRLPVGGGWSVLLLRPATESDEACALALLREANTLVHPGHYFDLPGDAHLVLSLLTPETTFLEGLEALLPSLQPQS